MTTIAAHWTNPAAYAELRSMLPEDKYIPPRPPSPLQDWLRDYARERDGVIDTQEVADLRGCTTGAIRGALRRMGAQSIKGEPRRYHVLEDIEMLESELRDKVMKRLAREPGVYAIKTVGMALGRRGTPDVLGCIETEDDYGHIFGRMFAIELKVEGNQATPQQQAELDKWAAAGAIVGVCHSVAEVEKLLGLTPR